MSYFVAYVFGIQDKEAVTSIAEFYFVSYVNNSSNRHSKNTMAF